VLDSLVVSVFKTMIGTRIACIGGSLIQRGPWGVQLRALSVTSLAKADSQRSALSTIWVPTGGITANEDECEFVLFPLNLL
jgi:prolyl-tRNA synthetase